MLIFFYFVTKQQTKREHHMVINANIICNATYSLYRCNSVFQFEAMRVLMLSFKIVSTLTLAYSQEDKIFNHMLTNWVTTLAVAHN